MKKQSSKKFKRSLPKQKIVYQKPTKLVRSPKQKEKEKLPRSYRIIPDIQLASLKQVVWNKYFLVSFISTFIGVAIVMQGIDLNYQLRQLRMVRSEREQMVKEVRYWEDITKEHHDYRDGYFKLALLEYQLGNREKARSYIQKTLTIDPNYQPAKDFAGKIGE